MSRLMLFLCLILVVVVHCENVKQKVKNGFQSRTGFPSPKDFQKITSPLLMTSSLSAHLVPQDSALRALPQSFATFVSPVNNEMCTLRKFLNNYRDDSNIYLDGVIIDAFKALLPLPSLLNCPYFTDTFYNTRMIWRWSDGEDVFIPIKEADQHSLLCLLDGQGKFKLPKVKDTKVKSGDCIYLPPKHDISWSLQDRVILIVLTWNSGPVQKCPENKNNSEEIQTLAYFNFKNDPAPDLFRLLSLNTFSKFIEDYHLSKNCTEEVFIKRFQKKQIKKGLNNWDEECQEIAKELFHDMDTDKNSVLSTDDLESVNYETFQLLAGLLEDRLADTADIAEDQEDEKPKKKKIAASLADNFKKDYEKELQAILEDGFNEILQEANIQGKVSFDKDGNPQVVKTEKAETINEMLPEENRKEDIDDASSNVEVKDEL